MDRRDQIASKVSSLTATVQWLESRIDALELGPIEPGRYCWRHLRPQGAEPLWRDLLAWMDWIVDRYELHDQIPACWYRHGALIEEFTALFAAWNAAYLEPEVRGTEAAAWHDSLARVLARVREWDRQGCRDGVHRSAVTVTTPPDLAEDREDFLAEVARRAEQAKADDNVRRLPRPPIAPGDEPDA